MEANDSLQQPLINIDDSRASSRASSFVSNQLRQSDVQPELTENQIEKAEFAKIMKSKHIPNYFKQSVEQYRALNYLEGTYDATNVNAIQKVQEYWKEQVEPKMRQVQPLLDANGQETALREPLEASKSRVVPFCKYLDKHNEPDKQGKDDVMKGFSSEADLCKKYFRLLLKNMDDYEAEIREMAKQTEHIKRDGKKEAKTKVVWNFLSKMASRQRTLTKNRTTAKFARKLSMHSKKEEFQVVQYYQLDIAGYTMVPVGDRLFAVQTAFIQAKQAHVIRFFEVIEKDEDGQPMKHPILQQVGDDFEQTVRQRTDPVKTFLNNQYVSFKVIGCRVYFFKMHLVPKDKQEGGDEPKSQSDKQDKDNSSKSNESSDESEGFDSDRGLKNDMLDWRLELNCFNLHQGTVRVVQDCMFQCQKNYINDDIDDNDFFECVSVFFVNDMHDLKDCSSEYNDKQSDQMIKDELVIVYEAVITPDDSIGQDHIKNAIFHLRGITDAPEAPDKMKIKMDLEQHDLHMDLKESCLNVMNPIKVFQIREPELISTLEDHLGKGDDDEWQVFPLNMESLVVICSFNDGNKGPNDHANEQIVLPDVFALVAVNKDGSYERIVLPQHRCYEKTKRDLNRDQMKNHKKLNKALKQLALHNSSSETWHDRIRGQTFNRAKPFTRNESECFKQLFAYCNKNNKERVISDTDKIYLGKGTWADDNNFNIVSCATHTNKIRGQVTVLVHIIWDTRKENVRIWNVSSDQWFKNDGDVSESKINKLFREAFDEARQKEEDLVMNPLTTISRHFQTVMRSDQHVMHVDKVTRMIKRVKDHDFQLTGLLSNQVFTTKKLDFFDKETKIQRPKNKSVCTFFIGDGTEISQMKIFDESGEFDLFVEDIDFSMFDQITRKYVQPLQVVFAEDDRKEIPCLVYNLENSGKVINDVAFVIIDPTQRKIRDGNFIDLQFGAFRRVKDINLNWMTQLVLTMSSEIMQGKRSQPPKMDTATRVLRRTLACDYYYTQKFQAAKFENNNAMANIVEIAVKYVVGWSVEANSIVIKNIESCVSGVKTLVFNTPGNFDVTLTPLMVEEENYTSEIDDDDSFRIIGTQLSLYVPAERDEDTFDQIVSRAIVTYNLVNPSEEEIRNPKAFTSYNEFTNSKLHEVFDGRVAVFAQTWLKAELVQMSFMQIIKDSEWLRILKIVNKVNLNMKLQNLPDFINSYAFMRKRELEMKNVLMRDLFSNNLCKAFGAMQVYKGHSIAEITSNQKELESYIKIIKNQKDDETFDYYDWLNDYFTDYFAMNSVERVVQAIEDPEQRLRNFKRMQRQGQLMGHNIINFNINMVSLMQVRIEKNDRMACEAMLDYLQSCQQDKTNKYQQIMATMPTIVKLKWDTPAFLNMFADTDLKEREEDMRGKVEFRDYFDDSSESDEDEKEPEEVCFRLPLPTSLIIDEKLPLSSNKQHSMYNQSFVNYNKSIDYHSEEFLRHAAQQINYTDQEDKEQQDSEEEEGQNLNYSVVVTRDYSLEQVLQRMRTATSLKDIVEAKEMIFSPIEMAYFLNEVININTEVIIDSQIIREIVDTSYSKTVRITVWIAVAYLGLHVVPTFFMMSDMVRTELNIRICCVFSLACQVFLAFFEYLDFKSRGDDLKSYLSDQFNFFEFNAIIINVANCLIRIALADRFTPRKNQLNTEFNPDDNEQNVFKLYLPFVNFFIFGIIFIKLLNYMRAYIGMAHLVELTLLTFSQASGFTVYFMFWVCGFACAYTILGGSFGSNAYSLDFDFDHSSDYPRMPKALIQFLGTYRTSLADLQAPSYEKRWAMIYDSGETQVAQIAMIFLWAVWCIQCYICAVMLNNFLIAIVSQVFERVYSTQIQTEYVVKAGFNCETMRYEDYFFKQDSRDYFILATARDHFVKQDSEWVGIVNAIKKAFRQRFNEMTDTMTKQNDVVLDRLREIEVAIVNIQRAQVKMEEKQSNLYGRIKVMNSFDQAEMAKKWQAAFKTTKAKHATNETEKK